MRVFFRADASNQIGTGHVVRCLTLAKELKKQGANCTFICRSHSGNLLDQILHEGFETVVLQGNCSGNQCQPTQLRTPAHANWLGTDWKTDALQTKETIGSQKPDWLIIDHYALDQNWERELRPLCKKIMVIDDLADRDHECDLLLDQNLVANLTHRYLQRVPDQCACLLGPKFALLQEQYANLHPCIPPRFGPIKCILVFFSGADYHNLTGRTISAFLALERSDITLDVVINPKSTYAEEIAKLVKEHSNVRLHKSLPSLAPLMVKADLAIGAGGTTSWERCCLGLPTLVVTIAENQKPIAAELDKLGLIRWLGHEKDINKTKLKNAIGTVINEKSVLEWSQNCRNQVDGLGVSRVAEILNLNSNTQLKVRSVRLDDEELILQWANDPLVRQNAFLSEKIDPATHRFWFYNNLRNIENCRFYIVETLKNLPIGQVRFQRAGSEWEIHYGLDKLARGRNLGAKFLEIAINTFQQTNKVEKLFGRVKINNLVSQKVFCKIGFKAFVGNNEIVYKNYC